MLICISRYSLTVFRYSLVAASISILATCFSSLAAFYQAVHFFSLFFFYSLLLIFQNFRRRTFKDEFKDLFKNGMLLSGLLYCRVILKCDVICSYTVGISETACILLRFKYSCSLSSDNYSCSV